MVFKVTTVSNDSILVKRFEMLTHQKDLRLLCMFDSNLEIESVSETYNCVVNCVRTRKNKGILEIIINYYEYIVILCVRW